MDFILNTFVEGWRLFLEASVYIMFGLLASGLLRVFLHPDAVAHHLGEGRYLPVFKSALLGIPIPLCSCGVLPAAVSLKKQGANHGATTAFLISTPESGVDSIAITYALLDPIMTVARPVVAFITAAVAGLSENVFRSEIPTPPPDPDLTCPEDGCCDGLACTPQEHAGHHSFVEKLLAGIKYAFTDVWKDMAGWFFLGLVMAGVITTLIPDEIFDGYLHGGLWSMLLMLAVAIPLYVCATASTPVAAALILKGVSPGAALVFLLAGPATNITSLTVLFGILGKRATAIYLTSIALLTVAFGLVLDQVYAMLGISAHAVAGQATAVIPEWMKWSGAFFLLILSLKPFCSWIRDKVRRNRTDFHELQTMETRREPSAAAGSCGGAGEVVHPDRFGPEVQRDVFYPRRKSP